MSDMTLSSGQEEVLKQLFLDGPTADGSICCKASRKDLVEIGLALHHRGFAQLTPWGLTVSIDRQWPAEKEQRYRDRNQEFVKVSDDSGHDYVIPIERRDDWDAWVEQLNDGEPEDIDYDQPSYAYPVEGDLSFTWPRAHDVAIVERLRATQH